MNRFKSKDIFLFEEDEPIATVSNVCFGDESVYLIRVLNRNYLDILIDKTNPSVTNRVDGILLFKNKKPEGLINMQNSINCFYVS